MEGPGFESQLGHVFSFFKNSLCKHFYRFHHLGGFAANQWRNCISQCSWMYYSSLLEARSGKFHQGEVTSHELLDCDRTSSAIVFQLPFCWCDMIRLKHSNAKHQKVSGGPKSRNLSFKCRYEHLLYGPVHRALIFAKL